MFFQMESHAMRNRLQVSFWGLHLTAEGIVAIAAALLIVVAVLAASRILKVGKHTRLCRSKFFELSTGSCKGADVYTRAGITKPLDRKSNQDAHQSSPERLSSFFKWRAAHV